jgi:hypothetical protein
LGHGYDALKILPMIPDGFLYGLDIQEDAISSTHKKLVPYFKNFKLFCQSHVTFPHEIKASSVKLIVYNLGYLPKSNKEIKTQSNTTLQSLEMAQDFLMPGGVISIMCYTGHAEGIEEEKIILDWAQNLDKTEYLVSYHSLVNRHKAPALCLIQKKTREIPDISCD